MTNRARILAVDFDGTLCTNAYPGIGFPRWSVIHELQRRQEQGDKLILWTCREGLLLKAAVNWCMAKGLRFDAVNDNLPETQRQFGDNPRKVSADEYWDDRAVCPQGRS